MKTNAFKLKLAKLLLNHYIYHNKYPHLFFLGLEEEGDLLEAFQDSSHLKVLVAEKDFFHYLIDNIPILIVDVKEFMVSVTFDNLEHELLKKSDK